jgi:hypothetical protein
MQATGPVQLARPPSAQRLKCIQQLTAAQPQVPGSAKTEWQSLRPSHAACVVIALQLPEAASDVPASVAKQAMAGQTWPQLPAMPRLGQPGHHISSAGQTPASVVAHAPLDFFVTPAEIR